MKPKKIERNKIIELHAKGIGATEMAKQLKIGRSTVYKLFKEVGINPGK